MSIQVSMYRSGQFRQDVHVVATHRFIRAEGPQEVVLADLTLADVPERHARTALRVALDDMRDFLDAGEVSTE